MSSRSLSVTITGDSRSARQAFGDVEAGADSLSTKLADTGESLQRFGTRMTLGVTLPLALLGKVAFSAASDLNESLSKVGVVFDDNARDILRWSKTSAEAFGVSRQSALEAAGTFGNLFRALGVGLDPATEMSKSLVGLAADLASFNNANPEDVLLALRSGLVGEAEPLRKFGVSLSAARVGAKVLELGLVDLDGSVSDAAKTQAAYAIILEDTVLAQGDFGNTSGGAAGQQRILTAQFQDTAAKLGKVLIPIFLQVAEVVSKVAAWFSGLSPTVQKFAVYAAIAVAAIGPLAAILGTLVTIAAAVSLPLLAVVAAIGLVVAAAVLLWLKWDEVWGWIRDHPALAVIIAMITGPVTIPIFLLVAAIRFLQEHWGTIWPAIEDTLRTVWKIIEPILDTLDKVILGVSAEAQWLGEHAAEWFGAFSDAVKKMWGIVDGPLGWLLNRLEDIVAAAKLVKRGIDALPDLSPGGFGFSGPVGDLFRASGGPVSGGSPYIVGERGPELFVPGMSGQIVPNHALGGGGASLVINVAGSVITDRQLDEVVYTALARHERHNGRR